MKLYTKSGDTGQSSLFNGERLTKADQTFDLLGNIDTLNSQIGYLLSFEYIKSSTDLTNKLKFLQLKLLAIAAEIAKAKNPRNQVGESDIVFLEQEIDQFSEITPALKNLILPGGGAAGAYTHLVRTTTRQIERNFIKLKTKPENPHISAFLNRLSDFFFALARLINHQTQTPETIWE